MVREVNFVDYYLPPFMQNYKEPVEALKAEEPEFMIIWKAVDRVLYNHFISTADEYGISRYEKMLGIYPASDDTLESRRSRVQSKWFNVLPYTWRVLLQKLKVLCGDTDFRITKNFAEGYTLELTVSLSLSGQVEELDRILSYIIPENIIVMSRNIMNRQINGTIHTASTTVQVSHFTIVVKN